MSATTRIFVRSLPPSIVEEDFRNHFAKRYEVTDVKLLAHRRIGYVGFRTAEDAAAAVKHYNKSFIRMSRIGVELVDIVRATSSGHPESWRAKRRQGKTKLQAGPSADLHAKANAALLQPVTDSRARKRKRDSDSTAKLVSEAPQQRLQATPEAGEQATKQHALPSLEPSATTHDHGQVAAEVVAEAAPDISTPLSDQDWIRSRTSRLLGLIDDEEAKDDIKLDVNKAPASRPGTDFEQSSSDPAAQSTTTRANHESSQISTPSELAMSIDAVTDPSEDQQHNGRLFLRNLPYATTHNDLADALAPFGTIHEIHLPVDSTLGTSKGFAFVQYKQPQDAANALEKLDGTIYQGRLLHVLPAADKRDSGRDEHTISQLPIKLQKHIQRKSAASTSSFMWNSLYMNSDAVMTSISKRLGVPKSELINPSSSDAAVTQAQAETHVIQESKAYFEANGVDLSAFARRDRSETALLVKNFAYGTSIDELYAVFSKHGDVLRVLMPPSGTIAIVEFAQASQSQAAIGGLAYRKFKDTVLFLEKAPGSVFAKDKIPEPSTELADDQVQHTPDRADTEENINTSTLFVRNLNFATTSNGLRDTFAPLDGLVSARIKTKPDPKRPGQTLSMGFGFLEFRSRALAQAAKAAMDGFVLDGHRLLIKDSHKNLDAAEERRLADVAQKKRSKSSKIIIKNLPFEVTKKDIRTLFKSYGQLRAVRVPKKFDNSRKGYAFAEFTTSKEAEGAMDALRNTHLLGRRLVLEFATSEVQDAEMEIAKMQEKVGRQSNSVALQKLTAASERRKFVADGDVE